MFSRKFFAIVFCLAFFSIQAQAAKPKTVWEVKQAADVYFHNKNWTPFAATIELAFYKQDVLKDTCTGTLLFDPLQKKLLVDCFSRTNQPVFIFRNDDVNFLLYLPGIRNAWQGDMFQLEYSPEFNSHLKPLDLYRAISPEAFSEDQVASANGMSDGLELEIVKPFEGRDYLARRIILDGNGQIKNETFLAPDGNATTVVIRDGFQKLKNNLDPVNSRFFYAEQTTVTHPETGDKTIVRMSKITLRETFPDDAWVVSMPEDVPLNPIDEGKPVFLTTEQAKDARASEEA